MKCPVCGHESTQRTITVAGVFSIDAKHVAEIVATELNRPGGPKLGPRAVS